MAKPKKKSMRKKKSANPKRADPTQVPLFTRIAVAGLPETYDAHSVLYGLDVFGRVWRFVDDDGNGWTRVPTYAAL